MHADLLMMPHESALLTMGCEHISLGSFVRHLHWEGFCPFEMKGQWRREDMTPQEAIAKAIEGGYPKERVADLSLRVQAQCFLETSFWEALIRALGVEGDFEYIHLQRGEPRKMRQPLWLYYWHRFNSHLATGKTPESFFANL